MSGSGFKNNAGAIFRLIVKYILTESNFGTRQVRSLPITAKEDGVQPQSPRLTVLCFIESIFSTSIITLTGNNLSGVRWLSLSFFKRMVFGAEHRFYCAAFPGGTAEFHRGVTAVPSKH
jgi:hypothetical protein